MPACARPARTVATLLQLKKNRLDGKELSKSALHLRKSAMVEIQSFCTLCGSQCGTINVVENGRLVAVRNDPSHPTGHAVCPKGRAGPEIVAANNRILYPMRRTRPKTAIGRSTVAPALW